MARGGSSFDDLVQAALKQLQSGRPQSAVRSTIDDAIKTTSSAASAVKSALAKVKKPAKPKVTSKTAGTTSARPAAPKSKAERRLENQRKEAERLQNVSDDAAAKKKIKKAEKREKYLNKEKQKIDERYSPKTQREGGSAIVNNTVKKKLNAIEYKERLSQNKVGELDRQTDKLFADRMASIKEDGYVLTKGETKEMYASIRRELAEKGERNLDTMSANLREKFAKYNKLSPKEMDTELGRVMFRSRENSIKVGNRPVDKRSRSEILEDKRLSDAAEAAAAKKANKTLLSEKGTGPERGPRPDKPFKESKSGLRLQQLQREGAEKAAKMRTKERQLSGSSKKYSAAELKDVKVVTAEQAAAAKSRLSGSGEGYNMKASVPLRSGRRNETVEELNARIAANRAKIAKESKTSKSKRK